MLYHLSYLGSSAYYQICALRLSRRNHQPVLQSGNGQPKPIPNPNCPSRELIGRSCRHNFTYRSSSDANYRRPGEQQIDGTREENMNKLLKLSSFRIAGWVVVLTLILAACTSEVPTGVTPTGSSTQTKVATSLPVATTDSPALPLATAVSALEPNPSSRQASRISSTSAPLEGASLQAAGAGGG